MKEVFYTYVLDWDDEIAAGTTVEKSRKTDNQPFVVDAIGFVAWIASASASAIIGTPLIRVPHAGNEHNELPSLGLVDLEFTFNEISVSSSPVNALLCTGEGHTPFYPLVKPAIPAGRQFGVKLTNNTAVGIKASLALIGHKEY